MAAFRGVMPTGGYSLKVSAVRVGDGSVEVVAELKDPPPGSMVSQALTCPYSVVSISRGELGISGRASFVLTDEGGRRLAEAETSL